MLNSGKKIRVSRDKKNKYSNSLVVRKIISVRKKNIPPLQVKWSVPTGHEYTTKVVSNLLKLPAWYVTSKQEIYRYAQYITETEGDIACTYIIFLFVWTVLRVTIVVLYERTYARSLTHTRAVLWLHANLSTLVTC